MQNSRRDTVLTSIQKLQHYYNTTLGSLNLFEFIRFSHAFNLLIWGITCVCYTILSMFDKRELGYFLLFYTAISLVVKTATLVTAEHKMRTNLVNDYPFRLKRYSFTSTLILLVVAISFFILSSKEITYFMILVLILMGIYYYKTGK